MTAPLMPRATAVWLVENTTLTFRQISVFCEIHELEIQAIADGDVSSNIRGLSPIDNGQLTWEEIRRCEADAKANLEANQMERNVKAMNAKAKKVLSPSQRQDKPSAILWVVKNYPDLKDSQICKIIGTTKPTIEAIRNGTHKDSAVLRPKNPVTIGLCSEADIEKAVLAAQPKPAKEKKVKEKKAPVKKAAKAKKETQKEPKVKKETKAKAAPKKAAKKTAAKTVKKAPAKKAAAKKTPAKKTASKKAEKAKK